MGKCNRCGNEYDKSFDVTANGKTYTYDSFECAISELAPECDACGVKIVGHGVEGDNMIFCCAHCAEMKGVNSLKDRV
jgi:hypothetical protein